MTFYSDMAATATRLIGQFGKAAGALLRSRPVAYSDPVAGTVAFESSDDVACNAVRVGFDERYTPGALVEIGDQFWVLDELANPEDHLVIDGVAKKIVQVWPITPADEFIACRVQIRG